MPYWPCPAGFARERKHTDLAGLLQIRLPEAILLAQALWEHCRGQEAGLMPEADVLHVARQEAATYGYRLPAAVDIIAALTEAGHLKRLKSGALRLVGFDKRAGKAARAARREKGRWRDSKRRQRAQRNREMSRVCPKKKYKTVYEKVPRDMTGTVGKESSSYQKKIHRDGCALESTPPSRGEKPKNQPELPLLGVVPPRPPLTPDEKAKIIREAHAAHRAAQAAQSALQPPHQPPGATKTPHGATGADSRRAIG